jgi:Cu(I)/Ag(I) efflux system membrane fusion protein
MMYAPDDMQPEQQNRVVQVPPAELGRLAPIVEAYLSLQRALADDDLSAGQAAATKLSTELVGVFLESSLEAKTSWDHFSKMLNGHAKVVAGSDSLEQARKGFEGLSGTMVMILRVLGNPLDRPIMQAHCPMARGSDGASWIQEGTTLDNSYFGASMLDCGDIVSKIKPGVHLKAPEQQQKEGAALTPARGHGL